MPRQEFFTLADAQAIPEPKQVLWHLDRFVVLTGDDIPQPAPAQPASISVSPRQFRQALTRAGLRKTVEDAIKVSDQDIKDWYEFATEFVSDHPMTLAMAQTIGKTRQDVDALFQLAAGL